jgi:hypothetical protein
MLNESIPKSARQLLAELGEARDAARVRLHLLSMEAHQRWQRLETTLEGLENKLRSESEGASESVRAAVRESLRAVKELLQHEAKSSAGGPPAGHT